jgi:HD superfamily phosphohydrolase
MVKLILQRAARLAVQDRLAWPPRDHVVYKALLGQTMSISEFVDLDDISILQCFKLWQVSDDATLAGLCRGVLYRRLYKTIDLSEMSPDLAAEAFGQARAAIESAGGEPAYEIFYDEPAETAYQSTPGNPSAGTDIRVRQSSGKIVPLSILSPLPQALDKRLMFRRVHVAESFRDIAAKAMAHGA